MARYEMRGALDFPLPLGACAGYWGYDLKHHVEPRLQRRLENDLSLPDCHLGFYDSLLAVDHLLGRTWIISTGMRPDGSVDAAWARHGAHRWQDRLESANRGPAAVLPPAPDAHPHVPRSNLTLEAWIKTVLRAQALIRAGDIYQVNLSQRFEVPSTLPARQLRERLWDVSPAPFSALVDAGEFQILSTSPEQFLSLSGSQIKTCPIKGTRPRGRDAAHDEQLACELRTSPKELAELVMITDLLRNDLGRVCEYGSIHVPELAALERFAQVQHLVSTIEGRLLPGIDHAGALERCFPGGSITGAPKFRAMEIIEELEAVARGPYTGALGYLGFNRESQLSIIIRAALHTEKATFFQTGAGIVADSNPTAEYEETLAKAAGFFAALQGVGPSSRSSDALLRPDVTEPSVRQPPSRPSFP